MAQLALRRRQPDFGINSKYFVDSVECFDVGEDTKVRGFPELRFGIAEVQDYFPQQLGAEVVLDIFRIEVDDLEDEHGRGQVDFLLL